jgi:hypothetical protein
MPVLIKRFREVRAHWHATADAFTKVLPKTGGDYRADFDTGGLHAVLRCINYPDEVAVRLGGTQVLVVPFLPNLREEEPQYWLGWHEEWEQPRQRSPARTIQFRSTAITIYYGQVGAAKRQLLRAEWAGAESYDVTERRHVFQADGAGHPHWHVDGIRSYYDDIGQQIETALMGFDSDQPELCGLISLSTFETPTKAELAWTGIHLAAAVRWAVTPWPGPTGPHEMHAASPTDCAEIRCWLASCARYLQVQFQQEIGRGRL